MSFEEILDSRTTCFNLFYNINTTRQLEETPGCRISSIVQYATLPFSKTEVSRTEKGGVEGNKKT